MDKSTAMNLLKNTFVKYTLIDGTTVNLTLAFALLKALEGTNSELAERYDKITAKNEKDWCEYDIVTILYTAYCCANLDDPEMLNEEVFCILMGSDRFSLRGLFNQLMGAKKKPASVTRS